MNRIERGSLSLTLTVTMNNECCIDAFEEWINHMREHRELTNLEMVRKKLIEN